MSGYTLDAGALIALERNDRRLVLLLREVLARDESIAVPAAVIAQVWRDGRRQARLARLLRTPEIEIVLLDELSARAAGQLCGASGTADVVDAMVVWCAHEREQAILTSDVGDFRRLAPDLKLIPV
jgi:predicted nucleic acid-binding protein